MTMSCLFIINFVLNLPSFEVGKVGDLIASRDYEYSNDFIILIINLANNYARLVAYQTPIDILLHVLKISFDHINYYLFLLI